MDHFSWSAPSRWPRDPPGYTFLARAFDRIGRAMFPDWRGDGKEGEVITEYPDALPRSAIRVSARTEVGDDDPQKVEGRFLALLEEAKGLQARGRAVEERIMTLAETGELVTATAERDGGQPTLIPKAKGYWNLNQPQWRFRFCMMSRQEPTRPPRRYRNSLPYDSEFHWVYVENTSLDRVLRIGSPQSAEPLVAEAQVENVLAGKPARAECASSVPAAMTPSNVDLHKTPGPPTLKRTTQPDVIHSKLAIVYAEANKQGVKPPTSIRSLPT